MFQFLKIVNPIQIYIFVCLLVAVCFYDRKNKAAIYLFAILLSNFVAEVLSILFQLADKPIAGLMSITSFTHNSIWLLFLINAVKPRHIYKFLFAGFVVFAMVNFSFFEGLNTFNSKTFILGALLYLVIFIYESFYELQQEAFSFFLSNRFVLLCAPLLFFIGLSFVLGFKDRKLGNTILFGHIYLYQFIAYFVNVIYYSVVIAYIYREKKIRHAE